MRASTRTAAFGSNPMLDSALGYRYAPYRDEPGVKRVVAFGDHSHRCPTYVTRVPPCTRDCPAGEDIRGYHNLLTGVEKSASAWEAAWRRIVDRNPFPAVMGRVCPHPCESGCNRARLDEAVGINAVEHAIGDFGIEKKLALDRPAPATGKRVAVVGGGPAGLSAAYQLARRGHEVTLFDEKEKLGGMMRYGIMGYRVHRSVLDAEIQRILDLGVKTRPGVLLGRDVTLAGLERDYDAVFVGVGAQQGTGLPVPGFADSPDATNAIRFLADFEANGNAMRLGKNVAVVGDGDVSMDVARLALRLGVRATLLSAVARQEMACRRFEFDDAAREGATLRERVGVVGVVAEQGRVRAARCVQMQKKAKGEGGYDSPVPFLRYKPVAGSEFEVPCDMIVAAIGQRTDMAGLEALGSGPFLQVDEHFRVKGREKVFGGGDALRIDLIATAVGHGRKAAECMHLFLSGQPPAPARFQDVIPFEKLHPYYYPHSAQQQRSHLEFTDVAGNFEEPLKSLPQEAALAESKRCMSCGLCFECRQCVMYCPQEAISYFKSNGIGQAVYTDYTKCVGCTICADACPCGYIQMGMGEDL